MKPVDPWDKMDESERAIMVAHATDSLRDMMREVMATRHYYQETENDWPRDEAINRLRRESDSSHDDMTVTVKNMCDRVHNREKK